MTVPDFNEKLPEVQKQAPESVQQDSRLSPENVNIGNLSNAQSDAILKNAGLSNDQSFKSAFADKSQSQKAGDGDLFKDVEKALNSGDKEAIKKILDERMPQAIKAAEQNIASLQNRHEETLVAMTKAAEKERLAQLEAASNAK